jgi:hypothetical protein
LGFGIVFAFNRSIVKEIKSLALLNPDTIYSRLRSLKFGVGVIHASPLLQISGQIILPIGNAQKLY